MVVRVCSEEMLENSVSDEGLEMGVSACAGSGEGLLRLVQRGEGVHNNSEAVGPSVGDGDVSNGAVARRNGVGGARVAGDVKELVAL